MGAMRGWAVVLLAAVALLDAPTSGQGAQRPSFRGSVNVVPLTVTVTDASRRYVTNLERADFEVLEDGRRQEIQFFQETSVPLVVALLLDTSASMDRRLSVAQKAAVGFVRALGPSDAAMAIDFDSRIRVHQGLTKDAAEVEEAIRRMKVGGSTALYNAVYIALKELNKSRADQRSSELRRRSIVVLSDGEDTSSIVTFDEVLDLATRSDTSIYAIGLLGNERSRDRRSQEAKFALRELADRTGGRAFFPDNSGAFAGIYTEIKTELSSQYSLAYESDNPRQDGKFRRISVKVARDGVAARTRAGYYAPTK
jgi:Ca-activated chloride channel family protein